MTYVASPSGGLPGNILAPADSDFESGNPTWTGNLGVSDGTFESGVTGWVPSNCTVVQSSAQAHSGTHSMQVTVTGTPAQAYVRPASVPVIPGVPITPVAWVMATSAETFTVVVDWFDENDNYLSTTGAAQVSPATFTWTELTETVVPPAAARRAQYGPTILSPASGSYFYVDDVTLSLNSTVSGLSTAQAFTGDMSLAWFAQAAQDAYVVSGLYPCVPNKGYDFSGVIQTSHDHDIYMGVQWYDAFGSPLGSVNWSQDFSLMNSWQPLTLAATSPSNSAQFKIVVWVGTNVSAGETFYLDLMYAAKTNVQILADWCNPVFFSQSSAGVDFFDLTPWVRLADNIQMTRGRQSRVSEMSAGSATFNVQNDDGWFTKYNSNSPIAANLGGVIDLGARCQINVADETGAWHTRFDGQVAEIGQNVEAVGTTAIATFTLSDVLAYLNRQNSGLYCWTKSLVMLSGPWMHWSLDDTNNAGSLGVATETSGNNGPALHPVTTNTATASIQWGSTNGGVETLADASAPGKPDMWEFWQAGSDTPSSDVNALESGVAGPYTTPLPSAYFTPNIPSAGGSAQNDFVTNSGYVLTGVLSNATGLITPGNGRDYAVEAWYAMDPWIGAHASSNMGPYVVVSLGNSRTGSCLLLGVWNSGNHLTTQAMTYGQPPAFVQQQYGTPATQIANVGAEVASDKKPLPHHIVANITGSDGGATLELFVDGTSQGTITLPAGVVYDTVTVGGAHGGWGCFYGNIQLVSIYQRKLSSSEIQQHCNFGQYGMWESTTDNCIAQLSEFANIPSFWNALTAGSNGLSLTDYYDITNWSPLLVMQVYEQAEQGLLYVAANGALTFATRDQRQGHGAPDLMLPPDTYTSSLGYQLIDQYIINQVAVSTQTYQRGVIWQNFGSNQQYGPYSNGSGSLFLSAPPGGPSGTAGGHIPSYGGPGWSSSTSAAVPLPLITWSRSYAALGLPQYTNSPDPVLNDTAAWKVNTQSESRQTYSSLTLDLLTLDPNSGLSVSQLYGLDINDVVGLSGALPTSISNAALANELFLEGINETVGLDQWTLELYTSPADVQRAWIPGDPVYGVLGSTSRVGLSAADTSPIPAIGKDVAHDAGGPYWPPSFIVEDSSVYQFGWSIFTGTTSSVAGNAGLKSIYQGDSVLVSVICPAASTITVGPDSQGNTYAQVASAQPTGSNSISYVFVSFNCAPLNSSDSIPVTGSVSQNYNVGAFGLANVLALDGSPVTASSSPGTTSSISTADMSQPYDLELVVDFNNGSAPDAIPSGWNFGSHAAGPGTLYASIFWKQNQGEYNGSWDFENGVSGWGWYAPGGTISITQSNVWSSSGTYSLLSQVTTAPTSRWYTYVGISDVMPGDTVTFTATVHSAQALSAVNISVDWKTSGGGYLSTSGGPAVSFNAGETKTMTFTTPEAPANARVASLGVNVASPSIAVGSSIYIDGASYLVNGPIAGDFFSATHASVGCGTIALTFTMQPVTLNNPSDSGNQFIGSLEMRGLHDTLMTALQPPMTIVGDINHGQTIASGNIAAPEIVWDQIYADTAGGMSAIPGWQNWYVCTVPGFYEINGCARMTHSSAGGTVAGYIAVASQAAQAVAAGTATPETVNAYVCPVGEQHQMNTQAIDLSMSASTRTYLGIGDMVALCMTQNTGTAEVAKPFSTMSIRWCGYSTANDQVQFNSSLGGSGVTTNAPTSSGGAGGGGAGGSSTTTTKKTYQSTWGTTTNYAYWGTSTSFSPQLRSRNTTVYQGEYAGGVAAGSQFAVVVLNYSAIQSALSGATINWIKLTCTNEHFWYDSGGKIILGWSSRGPGWGNYYSPNGNDHMNMQQVGFGVGQKKTFYLGSWAKAIQSSAKALLVGNNRTTDLQYYSFWSPSFVLTVNYTK